MKLKCRIHEKEYDIVAGATFAEEYNETLDSGSIIIDQIPKIKNLKPYDDVYIWNADQNFNGYVNVGDTVAAEAFGVTKSQTIYAYFSGTPVSEQIIDDYLIDHFPTAVSETLEDGTIQNFVEFKSYKYTINGKTFPGLIDAWASNFLYRIDDYSSFIYGSRRRWDIDRTSKITFKITFLPMTGIALPKTGYFYLPIYKNSGVDSRGRLILKKDTSYTNPSGTPDELHVEYELFEPDQSWYIGPPGSIYVGRRLRLMISPAISSDAEPTAFNTFNIISIEKAENTDYSYYYYFNGNTSTEAVSKMIFGFNGLTKQQFLSLENVKVNLSAGGYTFKGICAQPVADSLDDNRINMHFDLDINGQNPGDGFDISLAKSSSSDTVWSADPSTISILWNSEIYPVDQITNDILDGLTIYITDSKIIRNFLPRFFKHLLVDNRSWEMLSLEKSPSKRLYKCKMSLMSETKRLEKIILPNISITQPIVGNKRSVWYYLQQFVDLYSPKIKFQDENNKWVYKNKYKIDARSVGDYFIDSSNSNSATRNASDLYINTPVREIFNDNIFAPEMSLTAPTLKDVLSRLMIVKDCIPIVKNDVIYAMKISEVHDEFNIDDDNFSFITESMDSSNYSTSFRREYGGAISQKNSAHMVEFLGFRTSGVGNGLMTLSNMVLETRFPIYKINRLYMCYYRTVTIRRLSNNSTYTKLVLIKQDITKLVLQNTVRNVLPADWTSVQSGAWGSNSFDEDDMAEQRIFTIGYSIGSNVISGWGETFSYISDLLGWTKATYTYIELIFRKLNDLHPWGVNGYQFLGSNEEIANASLTWESIVSPSNSPNNTDKLKSLFFEMDYTAMYSGAIIHSKENAEDDDIVTPDNCSSALSILEVDGLFEREKANRLANTEFGFIARFDDIHQMNSAVHNNILGAEYKGEDENAIIYHREYQIFDDCVLANFAGTHDYVLKNYFTSVFAKYRTYSYAGYDENVNRAETDKYLIFLSDDRCYYENDDNGLKQRIITSVLSAFSETTIDDDLNPQFPAQINGGYFKFTYEGNPNVDKNYFSDVNQFVSGYSLCFNIKMYDNMANGNYIKQINSYDDGTTNGQRDPNNPGNYVGSLLEWHKMPLSSNDGFVKSVGCYFGHFDSEKYYDSYINWGNHTAAQLYDKLFDLPQNRITSKFVIGKTYDFCKDNKETIDFTLQYELVNQDNNIIVSEWLMKLTDFNQYMKFSKPVVINSKEGQANGFTTKFWSIRDTWNINLAFSGWYEYNQGIRMIFGDPSVLQAGTGLSGAESSGTYVASTNIIAYDGSNSVTDYSQTNLKISLASIQNVVIENGSIKRITVKASLKFTKYSEVTSNGFTTSNTTQSETTVNIDLQRDPNVSGYEFVYIGQIVPVNALTWAHRVSLQYPGYGNESSADSVNCSMLTSLDTYNFPKTMYVLVSDREIEQQLVYEQYKLTNLPEHMAIVDTTNPAPSFSDIFGIEVDARGRPYIKYHCTNSINNTYIPSDNSYKSVQYWYYDAEGDGYLHFVFGINAYEKDSNGNDVLIEDRKIYISTLKNRNTKVYNYLHREVGKVMNFADEDNAADYGQQLFEFNEDEED